MSIKQKSRIVLLMCNNCKGMTEKLLPDIYLRFSSTLKVLPVECPSQMESFAVIKLLKNCADGVVIACPQGVCCCPANKSVIKRREIIRELLPVFGFNREQFHLASVSPLDSQKLIEIIDQMFTFINLSKSNAESCSFVNPYDGFLGSYKWLN